MGSRDDGVGVQQDTAAEVRVALGQADDEGEIASGGGGATDDTSNWRGLSLILADLKAKRLGLGKRLGDCRGHGKGGHRQSEREGEEGRHRGGLQDCCWSLGAVV